MLKRLHIQHYAIIDQLDIDFSNKLNIITGETGAGKSILMGALNLILGERADTSALQPQKKCIIEGIFEVRNEKIDAFFLHNDVDQLDEIVVRREISPNAKSRIFINDTPVSLTQIKQLSGLLVDLHQQFDTMELVDEAFQRDVIDALAENSHDLLQLKDNFQSYSVLKKEWQRLQQLQSAANKEQDYNQFLYAELEELHLQPNELENLDAELKLLSNAENIKQQLSVVNNILQTSDEPVLQQMKIVLQKLHTLSSFHPSIEQLHVRLQSSYLEIQDISDELEVVENNISSDAERIQIIHDKISAGYKLLKKHNVKTTEELLSVQQLLHQKLTALLDISNQIEKLENDVDRAEKKAITLAEKISVKRKKQTPSFVEKVNGLLKQVGMPNARLKVEIKTAVLSENGIDEVIFLFDANKSDRYEFIKKVASGGELSRLMLVIKSLVASKVELPTLIFDEIDSGISGEAARQVGNIMKGLSAQHQLIAITHQPQIAAKADAHYFVFKAIVKDKIVTSVKKLNDDERIIAIAQMLSGEEPTAAAIENAKEMVAN